jgi:nanoRNase/pAp phosphatase (c-di-AMP/oligoRNAs hydrolase)
MVWHYDHKSKQCKVSLRSFHDHVDASEIAKRFGGGGHRKIAGFQINGVSNIESIFDAEE